MPEIKRQRILDRTITLVTGATTLVTALAWNEAAKSLFAEGGKLFWMQRWGPFVYALSITILSVLAVNALATAWEKYGEITKKKDGD
jgi:hypothetical protein